MYVYEFIYWGASASAAESVEHLQLKIFFLYLFIEAQVLQRRSESSIYSLFCGPRPLERQVFTKPLYLLVSLLLFLLWCITAEQVWPHTLVAEGLQH